MLLTVVREYKEKATPGTLYINGDKFCYTIEPPKDKAIPEGEYMLHLTYSERFKRIMPLVLPVVGHTGIRIHFGNFVKDTSGCLLVGYDRGVDATGVDCVWRSKDCYNELFNWLQEANRTQTLAIEYKTL